MRIVVAGLAAILLGACGTEAGPPAHAMKIPDLTRTPVPIAGPGSSIARSQASFYYLPSPIGKPVAPTVLAPATTLPMTALCSAPIRLFQDGNAGPLFCSNGAIIVQAWRYFGPIDTNLMSLGPAATVAQVKAAINADFHTHTTNPIEESGYDLARTYHHWTFAFDYMAYVTGAG